MSDIEEKIRNEYFEEEVEGIAPPRNKKVNRVVSGEVVKTSKSTPAGLGKVRRRKKKRTPLKGESRVSQVKQKLKKMQEKKKKVEEKRGKELNKRRAEKEKKKKKKKKEKVKKPEPDSDLDTEEEEETDEDYKETDEDEDEDEDEEKITEKKKKNSKKKKKKKKTKTKVKKKGETKTTKAKTKKKKKKKKRNKNDFIINFAATKRIFDNCETEEKPNNPASFTKASLQLFTELLTEQMEKKRNHMIDNITFNSRKTVTGKDALFYLT
jgi:hypothetical protein